MFSHEQATEVYIIIGNGFDIECGLKTSYSHFIDFISMVDNQLHRRSRDANERFSKLYEDYKAIKLEQGKELDISKWETPNVNDISNLFNGCNLLIS